MAVYEQQHLRGVKPQPDLVRRREKFPDLGNGAIVGLFLITIGLSFVFWMRAQTKEWFSKEGFLTGKVVFWKNEEKVETGPRFEIAQMEEEIEKIVSGLKGKYAIYFKSLMSGDEWGRGEEEKMEAASMIKVPIILTLYKKAEVGELAMASEYVLEDKDKVAGAGGMVYKQPGTVYTYKEMARLMGKSSDNTAANVLGRIVGVGSVQKTIDDLGMKGTSFSENETTAKDVGQMFEKLYRGEVVSGEATEEILSLMTQTDFEERIPKGVPEGVRVAHKIGTEKQVIADGGIVYGKNSYILVILSDGVLETEALKALPEISGIVWEVVNAE